MLNRSFLKGLESFWNLRKGMALESLNLQTETEKNYTTFHSIKQEATHRLTWISLTLYNW